MAHKITIKSIDAAAYSQASNSHFIDVEVEVFEDEKLVSTRRFGYPLDSTKESILADLEKVRATLDSDKVVAQHSAKLEAELANAQSVKNQLLK